MVRLRLFAVAREIVGAEVLEIELADGATVGALREAFASRAPAIAHLLPHMLFAVGNEYAEDGAPIAPNAEVACIPPVSGG